MTRLVNRVRARSNTGLDAWARRRVDVDDDRRPTADARESAVTGAVTGATCASRASVRARRPRAVWTRADASVDARAVDARARAMDASNALARSRVGVR